MEAQVGSAVHPRYRGTASWQVKAISAMPKPLKWSGDSRLGNVTYAPKILWLTSPEHDKVLWFAYWVATSNTQGKMRWGGGPPMLEESTLLKLLRGAVKQGFFSKGFLRSLKREIDSALG